MKKSRILVGATLVMVSIFGACKKNDAPPSVPPLAEFATYDTQEALHLFADDNQQPFKLPIGLTQKADKDITINYSITSKTGAVEGVQYTVNKKNAVTIKAGTATDTLLISGIFQGYTENRIDTLLFTLTGGDAALADANTTFAVILRRHCPFVLSNLLGQYRNVREMLDGQFIEGLGAYECTVTEVFPGTFGKRDTLSISNFWESGVAAKLIVDWTDPFNITTTLLPSFLFVDQDYGDIFGVNRKDGLVISCEGIIGINISLAFKIDDETYIDPSAYSTVMMR